MRKMEKIKLKVGWRVIGIILIMTYQKEIFKTVLQRDGVVKTSGPCLGKMVSILPEEQVQSFSSVFKQR